MAYHPENVEVPLGQIKIEHRKTSEGGIEQIAVIPPEVIAKSLASMYYGSLADLAKNLDMAESSLWCAEGICKRFMKKFEGGYIGK